MSHHVFKQEAACDACKATGLYVGLAERDGSAVVCHRCKGTGEMTIRVEWDDFEGRKNRKGVRRVVEVNPGICIGEGNGHRLEDFGGLTYEAWKEGVPFGRHTENRNFTCPTWWYQSADYDKKPEWSECGDSLGRSFSQCPHFANKGTCWARFDRENPA